MVSFSSAAVLLLAAATPAYASEPLIAGYEPATEVTDHARIDLDQQLMEAQLNLNTNSGYSLAKDVYQQGAFSKSIATLKLITPLTEALSKDAKVTGNTPSGMVNGELAEDAGPGAMEIKVQYALSNAGCYVGGHPSPVTDGCFNPEGAITIAATNAAIQYTYVPTTDTENGRTIQGFSTSAEEKMKEWPTYQKFYNYYGQYDYANQWVLAAFDGVSTSFTNGNANFGSYGMEGRTEAVEKGTAYMNVWMYVIHEMEDAIADCRNLCETTECNDDAVHAWDEAVAFYAGSLEGPSGQGAGLLVHSLAEKRCGSFGTCANGNAKVNTEIISKFTEGKRLLSQKECDAAEGVKQEIESLMAVPITQGTIRYAYVVGVDGTDTEKAKAEGAVFAASVLPLVAACNSADAETIYNNMRVGTSSPPDFAAVKAAFENNYECMGITCEDVGGLVTTDGSYLEGAAPCGVGNSSSESGASAFSASATAFAVAGVAALML